MNLADYLSEKPRWCPPGEYDVVVMAVRLFKYNTGTLGVEFELQTPDGMKTRASFAITDKALPRLAWFASTCGLTNAELRSYNPTDKLSHNVLIGKRCRVLVGKRENEQYDSVQSWKPADEERPSAPVVSESTRVPTGDEIPF